jgi:hypothetical protein
MATLLFDSAHLSPAMGVRSPAAAQPPTARQLLYSIAEYELDVRMTRTGDAWIVAGQVLSPIVGGQVELQGASGALYTALSDLSEFTLPPTAPGLYKLIIQWADHEVEVAELKVGI